MQLGKDMTRKEKITLLRQLSNGQLNIGDLIEDNIKAVIRVAKGGGSSSFSLNGNPISKEKYNRLTKHQKDAKITVRRV